MSLQMNQLNMGAGIQNAELQKYIKFIGEVQSLTDCSRGSGYDRIERAGKDLGVAKNAIKVFLNMYLHTGEGRERIYYKWNSSNRGLSYMQMANRLISSLTAEKTKSVLVKPPCPVDKAEKKDALQLSYAQVIAELQEKKKQMEQERLKLEESIKSVEGAISVLSALN